MEPCPEERGGINLLPCVSSFTGIVRFSFVYSCAIRGWFSSAHPIRRRGQGLFIHPSPRRWAGCISKLRPWSPAVVIHPVEY
jgi:hypothetical protein